MPGAIKNWKRREGLYPGALLGASAWPSYHFDFELLTVRHARKFNN